MNIVFWVFALLPVATGLVLVLFVLPDAIPIHWNSIAGGADRHGSKYELMLVFGLYFLLSVVVKAVFAWLAKTHWEGKSRVDAALIRYLPTALAIALALIQLRIYTRLLGDV